MHRITNQVILATAFMVFIFDAAHADMGKIGGSAIGQIGSPVVPSNVPKSASNNKTANQSTSDGSDNGRAGNGQSTILEIAFNQNRVNFQPALKEAILDTEKNFPGTMYQVASIVPTPAGNVSQATRLNNKYDENLSAVTLQIQALGVQSNRIQTTTVVSEDATSQVVMITSVTKEETSKQASAPASKDQAATSPATAPAQKAQPATSPTQKLMQQLKYNSN